MSLPTTQHPLPQTCRSARPQRLSRGGSGGATHWRWRHAALLWWVGWLLCGLTGTAPAAETALDRYVAKADSAYQWSQTHFKRSWFYSTAFLRLTSQRWRSEEEVDRPLWEHELIAIIPQVRHSSGKNSVVLVVDGGSNTSSPISSGNDTLGLIANALGSVVALVRQVPNQPLRFAAEGNLPRKEDALLAYTLHRYLESGDEEWPAHLPMTKSVVRAMDALQEYLGTIRGITIDDFILMGGSKRGWAIWLAAAVDPRVKAIVPISADLLNLREQLNHHWASYGFYAPALADYSGFDLTCRLQSKRGDTLSRMIDPWYYRERYTLPKLLVNSTGDQFFVSDSADLYYPGLPAPKSLRNTFNTGHQQGESAQQEAALKSALLWIDRVNRGRGAPRFTTERIGDGAIRVTTDEDPQPNAVALWQAHNPNARDFRLEAIGAAWQKTPLQRDVSGAFVGRITPPRTGWTAYAIELRYDMRNFGGLLDLSEYYTTPVFITPESRPFAETACLSPLPGVLENPGPQSHRSGISVLSGWACDAGSVELEIDHHRYLPAAYGTRRSDTRAHCSGENNGFGLLYNFNLLDGGTHTLRALHRGREIDRVTFSTTPLPPPELNRQESRYHLPDFPTAGARTTLGWQAGQQNFVITGTDSAPATPAAEGSAVPSVSDAGVIENPADGSRQSGIGLLSGWACDAERIELEIDGTRRLTAAYGTPREDTRVRCGDANNGFGLLYNYNLLGDGSHQIRLIADGIELQRARFVVTTLGTPYARSLEGAYRLLDFPRADLATTVRWDEALQNFQIEQIEAVASP